MRRGKKTVHLINNSRDGITLVGGLEQKKAQIVLKTARARM